MEVRVEIPDEVASRLQINGGDLSRRALEALAVEGYKAGELTESQVQQMLGFETRYELDGFLKERGVYFEYTDEDLAREEETSRLLQEARAQQ